MIRKTYELQTSVADQNGVLAAILDLIDMPFDENETLQWSIVDTTFNCYLEVGDEYEDTYARLYECDLEDLNISMEMVLDALSAAADRAFDDSIDDLDRDRNLFLKYE